MAVSRGFSIILLLVLLPVLVFAQVYQFEFTNWDDGIHIYDNPYLKPPTLSHALEFWKKPYEGMYIPVAYTLWAAQARLARVDEPGDRAVTFSPYLFHLVNLAVHIVNVLLVWLILRRLIERDWAAAAGALIFAIHPVQAEAVAWISCFRDLACGSFSLAAIWLYLVWLERTRPSSVGWAYSPTSRGRWWASTPTLLVSLAALSFAAALLCKPSAIVVPLIALVLGRAKYAGPWRRSLSPLLPWLAAAVPIVVITQHIQAAGGRLVDSPLWGRPLVACDAIAFYIYKLVMVHPRLVDYGRTPAVALHSYWIWVSWVVPAVVAILLWRAYRRGHRWPAAAGLCFVLGLAPVLGLMKFEFQNISTVADRYMYLPMLGVAMFAAWALSIARPWVAIGIAVLVLGFLAPFAAFQTSVWHDTVRLFTNQVVYDPDNWIANNNLGMEYLHRGDYGLARFYLSRATKHGKGIAWLNLADVLDRLRMPREAQEARLTGVKIQAQMGLQGGVHERGARLNLAIALVKLKDLSSAQARAEESLRIDGPSPEACNVLGMVALERGQPADALMQFDRALALLPDDPDSLYNSAIALQRLNRHAEAAVRLRECLRRRPNYPPATQALEESSKSPGLR